MTPGAEVLLVVGDHVVEPTADDAEPDRPAGDIPDVLVHPAACAPPPQRHRERDDDARDDAQRVGPDRQRAEVPDALRRAGNRGLHRAGGVRRDTGMHAVTVDECLLAATARRPVLPASPEVSDHGGMAGRYGRGPSPLAIVAAIWALRWWILAAIAIVVIWTAANRAPSGSSRSSGGGAQPTPTPASGAPRSAQSTQPGIQLGGVVSANPGYDDVMLGPSSVDRDGVVHTRVTVTNHSSKTSNYLVGLTMVSAAGRTLAHTDMSAKVVASGATTTEDVAWEGQSPPTPTAVSVRISAVDRWAR